MLDSIKKSLLDTISNNALDSSIDYAELALDSFLDDGVYKDIPFVRTIVSAYKIGKTIHESLYIRNLFVFLETIKNKTTDDEQREKYKKHFSNSKTMHKEIEYILLYCDKLLESENVKYISNIYLSLIEEKISFDEFVKFLSVVDKILPGDCAFLSKNYAVSQNVNFIDDHFLRLSGLGLMLKTNGKLKDGEFGSHRTIFNDNLEHVTFTITDFGNKFLRAIGF